MLAGGFSELPGIEVDLDQVQTNIVVLNVIGQPAAGPVSMLRENGILCSTFGPSLIRMVTHLDISPDDIEYTLETARRMQ